MIQDLIDWLVKYPEFDKVFDVSKEGTQQLIDFLGTDTVEVRNYVRNGSRRTLRDDYVLQVSRPFLQMIERKENADFLMNFQKWVDQQSNDGKVPLLGNHGRQRTWVDAQQYVENELSTETAIYQVRLHIQYEVISI